jgi:hypothetical protein
MLVCGARCDAQKYVIWETCVARGRGKGAKGKGTDDR